MSKILPAQTTETAKAGLQRSQQLENDKYYRLAMTDGFNALFARRYSGARSGFNKALQLKPEDNQDIKRILSDTLALSRGTANTEAQKVLGDAQAIKRKGPLLSQQIASLSSSLKQIDQPIKVAFNSDSLTQISLTKAGAKRIELGKFNEKKLALKPGRYTLVGTRLGFQDVRTEIELSPGAKGVQSFTIACTELIASAG